MYRLRGKIIAEMVATLERDRIYLDLGDEAMLRSFVRGDVCDRDMLAHACQFETLTEYQQWLRRDHVEISYNGHAPVSIEQITNELETALRRKYAAGIFKLDRRFAPINMLEVLRGFGAVSRPVAPKASLLEDEYIFTI